MQRAEVVFLTSLCATVLVSAVVILCLRKSLHALLVDLCGTEQRARFWVIYTRLVLVLMPVVAVLLARVNFVNDRSFLFGVMDQILWGLIGMIVALLCTAMGLCVFIAANPMNSISVSRDQADDLQRLLNRVEQIRARDILRRPDSA